MTDLKFIYSQFEVPDTVSMVFEQDGKSGLSFVYFVGWKYVLRWRPVSKKTIEDFENEKNLLGETALYIAPVHVPQFIQTKWGEYYVIADDIFWTLTNFIPGKTLSWISDVSILTENNKRCYIQWLFEIQTRTKNLKQGDSRFRCAMWFSERYHAVQNYFNLEEQNIIEDIVGEISNTWEIDTCFVHGDYHPGNILVSDDTSSITGLLDLDWCHVGSVYEDLSLIVLSLIRDISHDHFIYEDEILHLVDFYPGKINLQKLKKYILLRGVHDLSFLTPRPWWWMDKMKQTQLEIIRALINT